MAQYHDPDVTPRQAPAWRARSDRSSPVRTGRRACRQPRNPVLPALITQLSDRLKPGATAVVVLRPSGQGRELAAAWRAGQRHPTLSAEHPELGTRRMPEPRCYRHQRRPVSLLYDPVHFIMQTRQFHNLRTRVGTACDLGRSSEGPP
jgi:hypothetical protein